MTDEVSMVAAECIFKDVEGEDVEIGRLGTEVDFVVLEDGVKCFEGGCECVVDVDTDFEKLMMSGFCCVCILVLTTSNGQVMMPARHPAEAPVKISNGNPMSRCFIHAFASFCSCS